MLFQKEIAAALKACTRYMVAAMLFSLGINVLYLAMPLYMLQIYDRVLASSSVMTLVMLTVVLLMALATLAVLDYVRSSVLARSGIRLENRLAARIMSALVERSNQARSAERGQALRDLDTFRQFIAGGGVNVLFDAPWAPIFIAVSFLVHPLLGLFGIVCGAVLFALGLANQYLTQKPIATATVSSLRNYEFTEASLRNSEVIRAMGLLDGLLARWGMQRKEVLLAQLSATERGAAVNGLIRFLRLSMQSLMLGLGAYLAIERSITPGQMFAATILLARALQPIELAIAAWRPLVAAYGATVRIGRLLAQVVSRESSVSLPRPAGRLAVEHVVFAPPGSKRPILNDVQFVLEPGRVLGIIGPTAAGKSTLARVIVGVYRADSGVVRLDGSDVYTWQRSEFGRHVGYLPQDIELFSGTVGENIARFREQSSEAIVEAAQMADAHDMIAHLPGGYDTEIGEAGTMLSPGQRQRIALARALFGKPALVVLDEPNSNLDSEGDEALANALGNLKRAGTTVIVITHRIALLNLVDEVLALQQGSVLAHGVPQEVLNRLRRPAVPRAVNAVSGIYSAVQR